MKRKLLSVLVALLPVVASAYHAEIDGIFYNFSGDEATVTYRNTSYNSYSGPVVIPPTVTYNEKTYSVTDIGSYAFNGCSSLTSVTIPNSVTSIDSYAFYGCIGLTSVTIPNSVTTIGNQAFKYCEGLTSINIPESVTRISSGVLSGCRSLTSIYIPESVTRIDREAFSFCSGLTSINIPEGVTRIGDSAFQDCSSLTSIDIPNSVTDIGWYAFCNCSSLTSVTIPSSVTEIGTYVFSDCSSLTSINIPNSVTTIGDYAFRGCGSMTSITIPISVASIGKYAFYFCSGLTSITIPGSVTSIGNAAFSGCKELTSVASFIEEPFAISSVFDNSTYNTATLYVPTGTTDKYKATSGWRNFKTIKTIIELVAAPTASVASGSMVQEGTELFLSCETEGAAIWYTTDGSSPRDENGRRILYDGTPIVITQDVTIKAMAVTSDGAESEVAEFVYTVKGTGIDELPLDGDVAAPVIYYLSGRRIGETQKGINILRYTDGTSKKVMVK